MFRPQVLQQYIWLFYKCKNFVNYDTENNARLGTLLYRCLEHYNTAVSYHWLSPNVRRSQSYNCEWASAGQTSQYNWYLTARDGAILLVVSTRTDGSISCNTSASSPDTLTIVNQTARFACVNSSRGEGRHILGKPGITNVTTVTADYNVLSLGNIYWMTSTCFSFDTPPAPLMIKTLFNSKGLGAHRFSQTSVQVNCGPCRLVLIQSHLHTLFFLNMSFTNVFATPFKPERTRSARFHPD
jgi:hypothetical protein